MSYSDFEFLIRLFGGEKISKKKRHNVQESHFCSREVRTDATFFRKVVILTLACSTCSKPAGKQSAASLQKRVKIS